MNATIDDLINLRTDLQHEQDQLWAERYENRDKGIELSQEIAALPEGSEREALEAEHRRTTSRDRAIESEIADKDRQLAALDQRIDEEDRKEKEIQQLMDFMESKTDRDRSR